MQPLEYAEQFVRILHVKAHAVVAHKINGAAVLVGTADLHDRRCPVAGIFNRIGKQIDPDLFHQHGIARAGRQFAEAEIHLAALPLRFQFLPGFLHHAGAIHRLTFERQSAEPREREQIVNQPAHLLAAVADALQITPAFLGQLRAIILEHDAGKPVHGPQRRAQIVRDRIAERLQLLVRRLQLRRALADALLQCCVQVAQRLRRTLLLRDVQIRPDDPFRLTLRVGAHGFHRFEVTDFSIVASANAEDAGAPAAAPHGLLKDRLIHRQILRQHRTAPCFVSDKPIRRRRDAIHPKHLRIPPNPVGEDVPFPDADARRRRGEAHPLVALAQRLPGPLAALEEQDDRPDHEQSEDGGEQASRHSDIIGPGAGPLPVPEQVRFHLLHLLNEPPDGVHLCLALAGGDERRRRLRALSAQGDDLLQEGELHGSHLLQLLEASLLAGVVLGLVFQLPKQTAEGGNGGLVGLQELVLPRDDEATHPRLGVRQRPQRITAEVQHLMRMGDPTGILIELPGVAVAKTSVHHQKRRQQPEAEQGGVIEGASRGGRLRG